MIPPQKTEARLIPVRGLPVSGRMSMQQVFRYRALLAFKLRATAMEHANIARVLNLPSKEASRRLVAKGRRLMIDCVIETVMP